MSPTPISRLQGIIAENFFLSGYIHHNRNIYSKFYVSDFSSSGSVFICQSLIQFLVHNISSKCSAQGLVFHYKFRHQGCSSAQRRPSTANAGTQAVVLLWVNRCGSFPLLSAPHSLFRIWADLKISEKILGTPSWKWGDWIWLTVPSGLHRNSP